MELLVNQVEAMLLKCVDINTTCISGFTAAVGDYPGVVFRLTNDWRGYPRNVLSV